MKSDNYEIIHKHGIYCIC